MTADQAGRAADVFATITSSANTDVHQLGEAMKYASSTANAAGMDIEQTAAVLGVLADSGIKGSMAGTTFNAMLRDMKKKKCCRRHNCDRETHDSPIQSRRDYA